MLMYKLEQGFTNNQTKKYELLSSVFREQFSLLDDKKIQPKPMEEIESGSVQSPHDPENVIHKKRDQKIKRYSANVTETISKNSVNLTTDVIIDKANTADSKFVIPAIESTIQVTGQRVDTIYADGAYQSPNNDGFCKDSLYIQIYFINQQSICVISTFCIKISMIQDESAIILTLIILIHTNWHLE